LKRDSLKTFHWGLSSFIGLSSKSGTRLKIPVPGVLSDITSVQAALGSDVRSQYTVKDDPSLLNIW